MNKKEMQDEVITCLKDKFPWTETIEVQVPGPRIPEVVEGVGTGNMVDGPAVTESQPIDDTRTLEELEVEFLERHLYNGELRTWQDSRARTSIERITRADVK